MWIAVNNAARAFVLKLNIGHDALRILNARLSAWRNCVAIKSVFGLKIMRASSCSRDRAANEERPTLRLASCCHRRSGGGILSDRHFSLPAHVLFAKPVTTFAGHACSAYFALVRTFLAIVCFWVLLTFTILP